VLGGFVITMTSAEPFAAAEAAYDRGDYAAALRRFRRLAEKGNSAAQFRIGLMHAIGQGTPQDYSEAVNWYRMAADQGFADAQLSLGSLYERGQGVRWDRSEALKWFRKAAEQGLAKPSPTSELCTTRRGRPSGLRRGAEVVSQGGRARLCPRTGQPRLVLQRSRVPQDMPRR
jgi:hypothetical protein